jgi:mannose-1-phosphate guanylyltransferase/phosphomannomutase
MAVATAVANKQPEADFAGDCDGGFIFSEFQPAFDSMFAFGRMLEMISSTGEVVSDLVSSLPVTTQARAQIRCPWEAKGRVMRELTREAQATGDYDLTDGVKFIRGSSWVLVLPDAADPHFDVYAESATEEEAQRLAAEFAAKIELLRES